MIFKIIFFLSILIIIILYSFLIERNMVLVQETQISAPFEWKIAFISDLHLGKWKDENFLQKVIEKIEKEQVEAVLIGGDFLYEPQNVEDLEKLFSPLQTISIPVYAVLGNHDEQKPGPNMTEELKNVLKVLGVIVIEGEQIFFPTKNFTLVGLGDNWAKKDDVSVLEKFSKNDAVLVLTHNPDTTLLYPKNFKGTTLAGHTHGGQIRIPWLYKKIIPCRGNFDKGIHETQNGIVFVSSGIGEVDLPLRFLVPPQIEILNFSQH